MKGRGGSTVGLANVIIEVTVNRAEIVYFTLVPASLPGNRAGKEGSGQIEIAGIEGHIDMAALVSHEPRAAVIIAKIVRD